MSVADAESFDDKTHHIKAKVILEDYLKQSGLNFTILRPRRSLKILMMLRIRIHSRREESAFFPTKSASFAQPMMSAALLQSCSEIRKISTESHWI